MHVGILEVRYGLPHLNISDNIKWTSLRENSTHLYWCMQSTVTAWHHSYADPQKRWKLEPFERTTMIRGFLYSFEIVEGRNRSVLDVKANRFVGPVVLHEDILSSVLSSISKKHYDFIAVSSRDVRLLKNTFKREMREFGPMQLNSLLRLCT